MGVDLLNVRGLEAMEPGAPVVMVNLMRFRERSLDGDGSGWDAYLRYSALTVPMIKARGGTLLWTGDAKAVALGAEAGNQWDYLALVYYPTVAAFIEKHNRYSNWEARVAVESAQTGGSGPQHARVSLRRRLRRASLFLPFRPLLRFLYVYFWQLGFLDGLPGYYFARLHAVYELLNVIKTYELKIRKE